jgi:hypothetical protein
MATMRERPGEAGRKASPETRYRTACVPKDPNAEPFEGFDFDGFWDDNDSTLKTHVGAPATDDMLDQAERELGYKLPQSYRWLMRQHNGGTLTKTRFIVPDSAANGPDEVFVVNIQGVDPTKEWSLTGAIGSRFMMDEWDYPDIGVAICHGLSMGHDMVFLDYRGCGRNGEPEVVHIDEERDFEITYLSGDFESFVRGLVYDREGEE